MEVDDNCLPGGPSLVTPAGLGALGDLLRSTPLLAGLAKPMASPNNPMAATFYPIGTRVVLKGLHAEDLNDQPGTVTVDEDHKNDDRIAIAMDSNGRKLR
eukprot:6421840-Karenia_brevis.AAC.1